MNRFPRRLVTVLALAAAAAIAPAHAATPESGKVSAASPSVAWTGETIGSGPVLLLMELSPEDPPCEAPTCDTFALEVADGPADLEITHLVDNPDAGAGGIRVTAPDGTVTFVSGDSFGNAPVKLLMKGAKNGAYTVDLVISFFDGPVAYKATASLLGLAPAIAEPTPDPAASATPAPTPAPGGSPPSGDPGPAPAQAPAPAAASEPAFETFALDVRAPRLTARRLRRTRSFAATVRVGRPVADLALTLKRGSRVIAASSVGDLSGSRKVKLRTGALRRGRYRLTALATDERGVKVSRSVALRVGR